MDMRKNRELYNHLAERYDLRQQNPATGCLRKCEEGLIRKLASGKVLDLGCGTGTHLSLVENSIGLDVSEKSLKLAKIKSRPLVQGDIENLPIRGNIIDAVYCFYGTLNLVDAEKALMEISRVVKLGGNAILSVVSVNDIDNHRSSRESKIKRFRLEGKPVNMRLFEKEELVESFQKRGFKLKYFDSIFRIQKPRWGNFQKFSLMDKFKMKIERLFPKEWGRVYLVVFEKNKQK